MKNLSNIEHELDMVTKKYVDIAAEAKVDKVEGKQLSTNDFTTEEKEKLNSLENYTLPMASADALGGVKIGNNMSIDENGILDIKNSLITYINDPVEFVDGVKPEFANGWYVFNGTVKINGTIADSTNGGWFEHDLPVYIRNFNDAVYFHLFRYDRQRQYANLSIYIYYDVNRGVWQPEGKPLNAYNITALTTSTGLSKTNTVAYTPTSDYHPATKKYVDDTTMPKSDVINSFWKGTQAEYDALTTKSNTTLYIVEE